MANPFTLPSISGFNSSPPTDDGAQTGANTVEWQKHIDKIGTPLKVLAEQLGVNVQAAFNTIVSGGGELTAGTTLASAGTTDVLGAATYFVTISGTGTITSLGTGANRIRFVTATGAFTLTHHATSLILPDGVNITTAAGDTFIVISDGSSNARVLAYQRANAPIPHTAEVSVASASTCDILGAASERVAITGTTTITSFGTGANRIRFVRFAGALTLTHNATSLILPGAANITTAAGDTCIVVSDASSNARMVAYLSARPAFKAHKNGTDQTGIASAVTTKLTFTTEIFDVGGHYDAANSQWTPTAGKVRISATALLSAGGVDNEVVIVEIQKNGAALNRHVIRKNSANSESVTVTAIDDANGSDVYTAHITAAGAGNKTVTGTVTDTWFEGEMI